MKDGQDGKSEIPRSKNSSKKKKSSALRWSVTILLVSFMLSVAFNAVSETALKKVDLISAFLILSAFIFLGVIFDIFGLAAATASEKPFHAMAAKRVPAAKEALWLIKNAEKVSSLCNDVVGDICGIMSGSTAAVIVASLNMTESKLVVSLLVTGLVAGLTVGGKAFGKGFAIKFCNDIVLFMARCIRIFGRKK